MKFMAPVWTPACWAWTSREYSGLSEKQFAAFVVKRPRVVGCYEELPDSRAARARRHNARIEVLSSWVRSILDACEDAAGRTHAVRALCAWSHPIVRGGDIVSQWGSLPAPVRAALGGVCAVLGDRGGASTYGPIAAALRAAIGLSLTAEEADLCLLVEIDAAVAADDWSAVRHAVERHGYLGSWRYESGDPLPDHLGPARSQLLGLLNSIDCLQSVAQVAVLTLAGAFPCEELPEEILWQLARLRPGDRLYVTDWGHGPQFEARDTSDASGAWEAWSVNLASLCSAPEEVRRALASLCASAARGTVTLGGVTVQVKIVPPEEGGTGPEQISRRLLDAASALGGAA